MPPRATDFFIIHTFFLNFEKPSTSAALDVNLLALLHTIYKTTGRKEKTIVLVSLARPTRPISLLKNNREAEPKLSINSDPSLTPFYKTLGKFS